MSTKSRKPVRVATVLLVAVLCAVGNNSANAAAGDIYNLPTLDDSCASSGHGINASGQVTGGVPADVGGGITNLHAFRYEGTPGAGGVMRDLGTLGGSHSTGWGINASGQVAGMAQVSTQRHHAFRYDGMPGNGGVMRDLGTLPGGATSHGLGINAHGQVAGYSSIAGSSDPYHAFRYDGTPGSGGVMRDLGTLGGTSSFGNGINDAGQVTGSTLTASGPYSHAFRYDGTPGSGGIMRDLGALPGGMSSEGNAINSSGQIAGAASTADGWHAFRYDGTPGVDGEMHDLGTLGGFFSRGDGINNAGFVVGAAENQYGGSVATLWRPDGSIVDLDAWLDVINPSAGKIWQLETAAGISDGGLITGTGWQDGLGTLAFRLDASRLVVPEPSGIVLIGFFTIVDLERRRVCRGGRARGWEIQRASVIGGAQAGRTVAEVGRWVVKSGEFLAAIPQTPTVDG
jgi:probable HAF family extracellular repeat protein